MNEIATQLKKLILHESAQKYALAVNKHGNEVKYPHQQNYLTEADLTATVEGGKTIGIMLSQDKTYLTKAGAIDIDIPRDAKNLTEGLALAKRLQEIALKLNLRAYIEFSGSRGFHLWILANKPIYASLMQSVLKAISFKANFDCKEIFPNSIPESKCIKLPTSIHLKTGNRCGFIDNEFNPNNPQINLENQANLMAEFEQNSIEDLTDVANLSLEISFNNNYNNLPNNSQNTNVNNLNNNSNLDGYYLNSNTDKIQVNQEEINQKLNSFGNNHPSCINHLLNNGSPLEIDYNQANLTLVRYSISRNIGLKEAIALAELMAKNTSDSHSTSKDYQGKSTNFKSAYTSALRNKSDYGFSCSYVLANLNGQKLATRGCIGSKCPLFKPKTDYQNNSSTQNNLSGNDFSHNSSDNNFNRTKSDKVSDIKSVNKYYPLNQLIFEAMIKLASEDKEVCKSNIVTEVEAKIKDIEPQQRYSGSEAISLRESELLGYFLSNTELILDHLDLLSEGFITNIDLSNLKIGDHFDYLLNLKLPSEDTLQTHLELIQLEGLKLLSTSKFKQYQAEILTSNPVEVLAKNLDETEEILKQSLNDEEILPVSERSNDWFLNLLAEDKKLISTFSNDLNYLLNGGFGRGKLTVIGAPPANGKSTLCLQLADFACLQGFKVVYASYEMSKEQIFLTQLSRLGQINSNLLEAKVFHHDEDLNRTLIDTYNEYNQLIAPNLHIIEADDKYTPNRLLAITKKLKPDLLIIDYLQLMSSGDEKLDSAYQETLRVSKIATELKRLSRKADIPVIAISDVNKNAYNEALKGGDLDMGALRDSFKIAHSADTIALLISNNITQIIKDSEGNKSEKSVNQLYILAEKLRAINLEMSQKIEELAHEYKLDKARADTYSRLIIAKNRTGKCGELLLRYSKAIHTFDSLNYLTSNVNFNY
jgi:replicative DNA helicase